MKKGRLRFLVALASFLVIFSVAEAEEIRYHSSDRRDPFLALIGSDRMRTAASDELGVEGIIFDPRGDSYAVIGGEIYREGEEVAGSKIVHIFDDRVVFFQESQETVVWLREEMAKEAEE